MIRIVCFFIVLFCPALSQAALVTWLAEGTIILEASALTPPGSGVGSDFALEFEFDDASPLDSTFAGTTGEAYRYFDVSLTTRLTIDGVEVPLVPDPTPGRTAMTLYNDYSFGPGTDSCFDAAPCDGFTFFQGFSPAGLAQLSLTLRGPEDLGLVTGPGLFSAPPSGLADLSEGQLQLLDGNPRGLILGDVERVSLLVGPPSPVPAPAGLGMMLATLMVLVLRRKRSG